MRVRLESISCQMFSDAEEDIIAMEDEDIPAKPAPNAALSPEGIKASNMEVGLSRVASAL